MELLGRDPDLGAEAELAPVREPRRRVDHDHRRVHLREEALSSRGILGDDRFGVLRGVCADVLERGIQVVDDTDGDVEAQVLRCPVLRCGRDYSFGSCRHVDVTVHGHAGCVESRHQVGNEPVSGTTVHQHRLHSVTDARPLCLGVDDDIQCPIGARALIENDVNESGSGLDDRHGRFGNNRLDELGTAPRHEHIDQATSLHHGPCAVAAEVIHGLALSDITFFEYINNCFNILVINMVKTVRNLFAHRFATIFLKFSMISF